MGMFLEECERKLVLTDSCTHTEWQLQAPLPILFLSPLPRTPQTPPQTKVTLVPLTGEDRDYLGGQSLDLPLPQGSLAFCILRVAQSILFPACVDEGIDVVGYLPLRTLGLSFSGLSGLH